MSLDKVEKKDFWGSIFGESILWFVKNLFGLELNVLKNDVKKDPVKRNTTPAETSKESGDVGSSFLQRLFPAYDSRTLAKALYAGHLNGKRFYGVYATGDSDGEKFAAQYSKAQSAGLNSFVGKFKGTPITPDMITSAAQKYTVDPYMVAVVMANDSSMGTRGMGARNRNPGNVAQFDHLKTAVKWYDTRQEGVDAVAKNLKKRQSKLIAVVKKDPSSYTA